MPKKPFIPDDLLPHYIIAALLGITTNIIILLVNYDSLWVGPAGCIMSLVYIAWAMHRHVKRNKTKDDKSE